MNTKHSAKNPEELGLICYLMKDPNDSEILEYQGHKYNAKSRLLERQKVTDKQKETLAYLYFCMDRLFDDAREMNPNKQANRLRAVAEQIEAIEFQLQDNWNFPRNKSFHSYWYKIPHCSCPKMDNADRLGTGSFVYSCDCSVHFQTPVPLPFF